MAACVRYIVDDVSAAIEFYTKQLGFKLEMHPLRRSRRYRGETYISI
jgi:catechol 2,3-dioxygenase-like lactoylglutathione lyase family enzyme